MLQVLQPLLPDDAALLDPAGLPGAGPLLPGQDGHRSREAPHPRRHGSLVADSIENMFVLNILMFAFT